MILLQIDVNKYVEMVKLINFNVMMVILMILMDVIRIVNLLMDLHVTSLKIYYNVNIK